MRMRAWLSIAAAIAMLSGCKNDPQVDYVDLSRVDSASADLTTAQDLTNSDLTAGPDAALPDLAIADSEPGDAAVEPPDLFVPPGSDLTVLADLSVLPDLVVAPDLRPIVFDLAGADAAVTVPVSHARELRAAWVATVFRLDFPSRTNLSVLEARAEIGGIIDKAAASGLNAVFFQVRPESDALYASTLEPWSRFISGTQGVNPGYDALALFVEIGHAKGIEVHAWVNPYRALATVGTATASNHVTQTNAAAAITYNNAVTMDPSNLTARSHVVDVVTDITTRYDIDGVVFDDYFYPYPGATPYPDDAMYSAYTTGGGTLSKSDWRRDNVNRLIHDVSDAIRATKAWVRFGVAPFGIYRPGQPAGVTGLDAYEVISCDSLHWMDQEWVDYLSPQLYWETTSTGQPFGKLIDWWASKAKPGRPIIASLALYKMGTSSAWTADQFSAQVALTRGEGTNSQGQVWFRYDNIADNLGGIATTFASVYPNLARPPVVPQVASTSVSPPVVGIGAGTITLNHASPETIRGYAIYEDGDFTKWVPVGTATTPLPSGTYAISAIGRGGVESLGVTVEMP